MSPRRRALSAPQLVAASFAAFVLGGSVLLALPAAAAPGHDISYLDALFTAASAICVTGLIVVDTPVAFSTFGHAVILLLIQIGGLGSMTISTVLAAALGRSLSLQERLTLQEALNADTLEGLARFAGVVLRLTLAFELSGAAILAIRWWPEYGPSALWYGLFHSVSAFNNAGFALWSDSLMRWRGDLTVNAVVIVLITRGGLGFFALSELFPAAHWPGAAVTAHANRADLIGGPRHRRRGRALCAGIRQCTHAGPAVVHRAAARRALSIRHHADRGVQHARYRRHDADEPVSGDGPHVHWRLAGRHRRWREDHDV